MNILQVAPYFPPYKGGQEEHVAKLADHLRANGHTVKVLTSDYPPEETPDEEPDVHRLTVRARLLRNPFVIPQTVILRLFRWADVAHTHNEHAFISNLAALTGTYTGTPTVLTCHGQLSFGSGLADTIESAYNRTIGANTLKAMDRVIALSESDKAYLTSLGADPRAVEVIPNAIEPPGEPDQAAVEEFREDHGLVGQTVVLFVGPLVRRKSPETLIRAMPAVREHHPNAVGVFVGGGDHLDAAKAAADSLGVKKLVRFTGFVPEEQLLAAYRSGAVLAVPSVSEGLPTTIIEGMFHELPVVATDLDPIRDWFGGHAELVPSEPSAFSDAITDLLDNRQKAERMGQAGADMVRSRLTWDRVSEEVMRVYSDIVGTTDVIERAEHTSA